MSSRHLYIFIGQSFKDLPLLASEVLGRSLMTSLKLSRNNARSILIKVRMIVCAQVVTIVWAIDAWLMLFLAFALTVKQIQKIDKLNIDLAAYIAYSELASQKVLNYAQQTDYFAGSRIVEPLHNLDQQQG